ncbi:MAG: thiamine pyrophosphate-dependent enzyme [Bacteroidota bacterium]|nr:thiamine pyrophosphate-dependent enzyme [Bacteroidota bacterium]
MQKLLLMGDEAIAQGAIDAGISGIYAYPGTPSTEITEYVQHSKEAKEAGIRSSWSTNEKTAMEASLGMSYAGKRSMVCMKHVGLNVAADAFVNSAITGANGGIIVVVADDPSMHSSQNEQDSRFYGKFAQIPVLEPNNQQEAYDMVIYGFNYSEKYRIPVMLRLTTRLAHSRSGVKAVDKKQPQNKLQLPSNLKQFILLPALARKSYRGLIDNQIKFEEESNISPFNKYFDGADKSLGIISSGITFNYLHENFQEKEIPYPVLKVNQYPLPRNMVEKLYSECDKILVLEEGYPIIEESIRGYLNNGKKIRGRMDGSIQFDGELTPNKVAKALGMPVSTGRPTPEVVVGRPPVLCAGCPHIDSYNALNKALEDYAKGRVFSDIGCYTLGALAPFDAINSCVDMGASITMAKGAADAGLIPSVAVIGDGTFTHSGITGLLDCIVDKSNLVIIILDNDTTAMTGGQHSASEGGKLEDICRGVGVPEEHIRIIRPLPKFHDENYKIMKEELEYDGVSVIIPRRECVITLSQKMKNKFKDKKIQTKNI